MVMFDQDNKYFSFLSSPKSFFFSLMIVAGLIFIVLGMISLTSVPTEEKTPILVEHEDFTQEKIVVEVAGAVKKPGVYEVNLGDRVSDLVKISGGISSEADIEELAKSLNLAKKLTDAEKIYIPFFSQKKSNIETSGKISINLANQSQLENLDGVGEKRASEIILQRPYQSIEDLLTKGVLSESIFEKNKNNIQL